MNSLAQFFSVFFLAVSPVLRQSKLDHLLQFFFRKEIYSQIPSALSRTTRTSVVIAME